MNETKMTLTERNQKLYDLRQQLDKKRMELAWIEIEIMSVKSQYDRENIDLFEEMFGEKNTLWDHLDRMSDTPIAEEVYGG
jgi:exoribonuclease R